jgi:hypothetical protein
MADANSCWDRPWQLNGVQDGPANGLRKLDGREKASGI